MIVRRIYSTYEVLICTECQIRVPIASGHDFPLSRVKHRCGELVWEIPPEPPPTKTKGRR